MVLDEPKDTDTVFDIDGITFIVDEALLIKAAITPMTTEKNASRSSLT
jgi:hypothetical protein